MEDLLHKGRALITEFTTRAALTAAYHQGHLILIQNYIIRDLGMASSLPQIMDVVVTGLPKLNIGYGYVALNNGVFAKDGETHLFLAFDPQRRVDLDPEGIVFPPEQLIPPEVLPAQLPPALVVRALWADQMPLGFIIMELQPGLRSMYETHQELSRHIGIAIKGVSLLHQIEESNGQLAQRAELYYQQGLDLKQALFELQKAHTTLEHLNEELQAAQRDTEKASKAKSVFLSNMSHELRTPLTVIIGYANSMLNMPQMFNNTFLPEVYRPYLDIIEENARYLVGLINDVLDLSKIEAGRLELHPTVMTLPETLQGVISTSIGLIKEKPIQIRPEFTEDLPLVWADPKRVRQILLNLMTNAIKFTHTGSVTLHAEQRNHEVLISVIDTGLGCPPKYCHRFLIAFSSSKRYR